MIFLAIEETDVRSSLLVATEGWSVAPPASRKLQATSVSADGVIEEERLRQIHLQAGDE